MTGVAEFRGSAARIAPDTVRVSVLVERMQIDVSLPIDVPVALLIPELVRLRDDSARDSGGASADDARSRVWVLRRSEPGGRLGADDTLRSAGIGVDELLHLVAERTLSAPTLFDDVVDAAAQLNQSRHQGWTSVAARRVGFLGMGLVTAAWVWLVVGAADSPGAAGRTVLLVLSGVVVAALIAAAAALTRFTGQADAGMTLGWSAIPIAAAAAWVGLSPHGDLALAGGCAAVLLLCAATSRLVGAGSAGYVAFAVVFVWAGAVLLARGAGVATVIAGATVAVLGAAGCLAVPRARAGSAVPTTVDDDLGARVAAERALRAGCYAGLAVSAGAGAVLAIRTAGSPTWPALTLSWVCAVALLLQSGRLPSDLERATLAVPAGGLAVAAAFVAADYGVTEAVVGFTVVAAAALGLAAAGAVSVSGRLDTLRDYARYAAFAALVPVAFWVASTAAMGPW